MGHTRVIRHHQDAHMDPAQKGHTEETHPALDIDITHKNILAWGLGINGYGINLGIFCFQYQKC